ncbi:MAG: hypothetical protein LAO22_14640 [Acidobacteriia bacterium]|nr:hypothetical protein [Terriglobia bacterium]
MTADEKKRMLLLVRAVENLFSENCSLQTVLASHRIAKSVWRREVDRLMNDRELKEQLHAKFQHLYDEIERIPEDSKAIEELLKGLPIEKKRWN